MEGSCIDEAHPSHLCISQGQGPVMGMATKGRHTLWSQTKGRQ